MMAKKNYFGKMIVCLYCFLLVFCFYKTSYAQFASDVLVNDDLTIYDQSISNGLPSVVIYEDNVYATWLDARAGVTSSYDIYFAKGVVDSTGKIIFGDNIKVNDTDQTVQAGDTASPSIAVSSDGIIFIVWTDGRSSTTENPANGRSDIYLARSIDGGNSFLENQQIDILPDTEAYTSRRSPRVAVADDGYVYVIFGKGMSSSLEMNVSSDNGKTFGIATKITSSIADTSVIAADGSYVYIAHILDKNVILNISSDHGQTFGESVMINDDNADMLQKDISIAASGDSVYLVWYDERDVITGYGGYSIYGAFSYDRGTSFGSNIPISQAASSTDNRFAPSIAASGDNVGVSFYGTLNEHQSIISVISNDKGKSWTKELMVSDALSRPSIGPSSIAINDNMACVLWKANGEYAGNPNSGYNVYASEYVFGTQSTCPSGLASYSLADSVLSLPSLCIDGVYYESEVKIYLNFNTMTFELK